VRTFFKRNKLAFKLFILLFSIFILFGCNVKTAYNQLDWMIPWLINNFIPLNNEQYTLLDDQLETILAWHRSTQIPVYVDTLRKIIYDVKYGLSNDNLEYVINLFQIFKDDFIEYVQPEIVTFLETLTDAQIEILFHSFDKNNEEYKAEKVDPPDSEIRETIADEMKENIQKIFGSITENQERIIRNWSLQQKLIGEEELAEKIAWQVLFKNTLDFRHNKYLFKEFFDFLLKSNDTVRPAAYQAKLDYNQELMKEMLLLLDYSMTDEQRQFLINKMTKIADQLEELIEE